VFISVCVIPGGFAWEILPTNTVVDMLGGNAIQGLTQKRNGINPVLPLPNLEQGGTAICAMNRETLRAY